MESHDLESLQAARRFILNSLMFEAIITSLRNAKENHQEREEDRAA